MASRQAVSLDALLEKVAQAAIAIDPNSHYNDYCLLHTDLVRKGLLATLPPDLQKDLCPQVFYEHQTSLLKQAQQLLTEAGKKNRENIWREYLINVLHAHKLPFHEHATPPQTEEIPDIADHNRVPCAFRSAVIFSAPTENGRKALCESLAKHAQELKDLPDFIPIAGALSGDLPHITPESTRNALRLYGTYLMPREGLQIRQVGGIAGRFLQECRDDPFNMFEVIDKRSRDLAKLIGYNWCRMESGAIYKALVLTFGCINDTNMTPSLQDALPGSAFLRNVQNLVSCHGLVLFVGYSFKGPPENATERERNAHESIRLYLPLLMSHIPRVVVIDLDKLTEVSRMTVLAIKSSDLPGLKCESEKYYKEAQNNRSDLHAFQLTLSEALKEKQSKMEQLQRDIAQLQRDIPQLQRDIPQLQRDIPQLQTAIITYPPLHDVTFIDYDPPC